MAATTTTFIIVYCELFIFFLQIGISNIFQSSFSSFLPSLSISHYCLHDIPISARGECKALLFARKNALWCYLNWNSPHFVLLRSHFFCFVKWKQANWYAKIMSRRFTWRCCFCCMRVEISFMAIKVATRWNNIAAEIYEVFWLFKAGRNRQIAKVIHLDKKRGK